MDTNDSVFLIWETTVKILETSSPTCSCLVGWIPVDFMIHDFIISRLDYCNALRVGMNTQALKEF